MDRKTVFLVDDDSTNLTLGRSALEEYYNILTFNSGGRLLNMLEKRLPDLVLLDVEMPEMSGYETIRTIKAQEKTAHIPIIFLTARHDLESELEGLSLGASDYIFKPFSPPLLRKRIEVQLLVESQRKELIHYNRNLRDMVKAKTKSVVELQTALLRTMAELVEYRDDITGGHIARTQGYLEVLLEALQSSGLYKEEVSTWDTELVLQSALLHDMGKIAIKDSVLLKPGSLTPEEFEHIKGHAEFGGRVIAKIKENTTDQAFLEYALIMAMTHHEKWDGSGYPAGLKGNEIPLLGRLMAIADVYDALISGRPYKTAFTHEETIRIILDSRGTHFDPELVDLFLNVAEECNRIAAMNQ
jgi:putative two-component system response regulator